MTSEHQTGHRSADDLVVGLTGARFGGATGRRRRRAADQPPVEEDTAAAQHRREERPRIGQTGARFSAVSRRWRGRQDDSEREDAALPDAEEPPNTSGVTDPPSTALPGTALPGTGPPVAQPSQVDAAEAVDWVQGSDWSEWDARTKPDGMVRPYSLTGGRTTPRLELPIEALVSVTGQPLEPTAPPEHCAIMTLCDAPRSVAEFAALLSIPLGVTRVVLGDMAEAGSIVVHRTAGSADAVPDLDLMRRVLYGLQRL